MDGSAVQDSIWLTLLRMRKLEIPIAGSPSVVKVILLQISGRAIQEHCTVMKANDIGCNALADILHGAGCNSSYMGRRYHVLHLEKWIVDVERLFPKDIDPGPTKMSVLEALQQGLVIDESASGDVDQQSTSWQHSKLSSSDGASVALRLA